MKFMSYLLLIVLMVLSGCGITNPNNTQINEAMLIVENFSDVTIYIIVDDGSLGPFTEYTLLPDQTFTRTWESDDEVFVLNDGQVLLTYHDGSGNEETAIVQIVVGNTTYYTISEDNSVLIIGNDTNSEAWYTINQGNVEYLFAGDLGSVSFGDISFPIQIDLFYTGYHVFSNNIELTIYPYNTQEFNITANAGAFKLENNSLSDIEQVYIAPVDDQYWGENVLYSILEPNESAYWTVEPGWWDVRIIDEWGVSFDFLNNYVTLDGTDLLTFRSSTNINDELLNSDKIFETVSTGTRTERRIEFKNITS